MARGKRRESETRELKMTCRILKITLWLYLTNLIACTSTQTRHETNPIHPIDAGELVALLGDTNGNSEFSDAKIYDCLSEGMLDINPKLQIMKPDMFRTNLYPYFSASTTPHTQEEYKTLLNNDLVRQRIKALGIKYLIILIEAKTQNDGHGGIFCGGGVGGAGCLGLYWWNRDTLLNAQIWNLDNANLEDNVQTQAKGTGVLPALLLPFPVYMPATEAAACQELGEHLAKKLLGNFN